MKKLFTEEPYKRYLQKRSRKSLRKSIRFKQFKKNKNKRKIGYSKTAGKDYDYYIKNKGYKKIIAPRFFSFVSFPGEFTSFIGKLRVSYNTRQKVFVVLRDVTRIDYDAILVLLSIMVKFKAKNIDFNGDFPLDELARKTLMQSGFFENLYKTFRISDRYAIRDTDTGSIHTHAWTNVDAPLGDKVIAKASKNIWGERRRCQGVQRVFLELMQNTNNHASPDTSGDKHWWLSINYRTNATGQKIACFSFIDYGIGIFASLRSKKEGSKFFQATQKLFEKFRYGDNADLLKLIMNGELHRTVTGQHFRGKGLPGVKEALSRNQISNLFIITNNVYGNVSLDNYKLLSSNFEGTFLYWELSRDNVCSHA